jgi:hypothetical protein
MVSLGYSCLKQTRPKISSKDFLELASPILPQTFVQILWLQFLSVTGITRLLVIEAQLA